MKQESVTICSRSHTPSPTYHLTPLTENIVCHTFYPGGECEWAVAPGPDLTLPLSHCHTVGTPWGLPADNEFNLEKLRRNPGQVVAGPGGGGGVTVYS